MNLKKIDCSGKNYDILNEELRAVSGDIELTNCLGQRFIAAGSPPRKIKINGIPGNALGAYLNGAEIYVNGNAQDATGDTMDSGSIIIDGSCGDAAGYAMRGGAIMVRGDVGYRAGIHMKAYEGKTPVLIFGGRCGSFLGEYQAGGVIIALGLGVPEDKILGYFCGTGMHGGKIFVRCNEFSARVSEQISVARASDEDMELIAPIISDFCSCFGVDESDVYSKAFHVLTPNSANPYKLLYIQN
ncbi:MAG: glutamate synthase [Oscillospiraceae bacterium]|jgi:glutamate synthase domain-containing protein 3|nr:glutamate synthase [Oscillospiraceae bacterium]